ncbi:MAG: phosphodiesterase [Robiginitomaculum sp.]|nr:MAG: phosphodiesterase [Robiginitomaculum sp.]
MPGVIKFTRQTYTMCYPNVKSYALEKTKKNKALVTSGGCAINMYPSDLQYDLGTKSCDQRNMNRTMIIAQISDLHIGHEGKGKTCKNTQRLKTVVRTLTELRRKPDVLVITGDLVEYGEVWAYEALKEALSPIEFPIHMAFGNHDNREAFKKVYPDTRYTDGFFQYTLEDGPVRIIVLDTLEEGRHGGSFCETRALWLERELDKQPDRPTLIALHHPPIKTGIGWLSADPSDDWVKRLKHVISKYDNVEHIMAGHIHRAIFKSFAKTSLSVTDAIAIQSKLELADIDPDIPDGRGLFVDSRPGFCLQYWDGESFTTHSGQSPCGKTLIHFNEKHSHVVKHTMDIGL